MLGLDSPKQGFGESANFLDDLAIGRRGPFPTVYLAKTGRESTSCTYRKGIPVAVSSEILQTRETFRIAV